MVVLCLYLAKEVYSEFSIDDDATSLVGVAISAPTGQIHGERAGPIVTHGSIRVRGNVIDGPAHITHEDYSQNSTTIPRIIAGRYRSEIIIISRKRTEEQLWTTRKFSRWLKF